MSLHLFYQIITLPLPMFVKNCSTLQLAWCYLSSGSYYTSLLTFLEIEWNDEIYYFSVDFVLMKNPSNMGLYFSFYVRWSLAQVGKYDFSEFQPRWKIQRVRKSDFFEIQPRWKIQRVRKYNFSEFQPRWKIQRVRKYGFLKFQPRWKVQRVRKYNFSEFQPRWKRSEEHTYEL